MKVTSFSFFQGLIHVIQFSQRKKIKSTRPSKIEWCYILWLFVIVDMTSSCGKALPEWILGRTCLCMSSKQACFKQVPQISQSHIILKSVQSIWPAADYQLSIPSLQPCANSINFFFMHYALHLHVHIMARGCGFEEYLWKYTFVWLNFHDLWLLLLNSLFSYHQTVVFPFHFQYDSLMLGSMLLVNHDIAMLYCKLGAIFGIYPCVIYHQFT